MNTYYLYLNNEQTGPYTFEQVLSMLEERKITQDTHIWSEGFKDWVPISSLDAFRPLTPPESPMESPTGYRKGLVSFKPPDRDSRTSWSDKTESGSGIISKLIYIATALVAAGLIGRWYFFVHRGLPIPAGSYTDAKEHFSILPPEGWKMLTAEDYKATAETVKGVLKPSVAAGATGGSASVGFIHERPGMDFQSNVSVSVVHKDLPKVSMKDMKEVGEEFARTMGTALNDLKLETPKLVEYDRLKSIRLVYKGKLEIMVAPAVYQSPARSPYMPITPWTPRPQPTLIQSAVYQSIPLKILQVFVPGANKFYVITCSSANKHFSDDAELFDATVRTFRVTKRPIPFVHGQSLLLEGVKGGLKGVATAMAVALLAWVFSRR